MKLIFVVYSEDINRQVMLLLKQVGVERFTQWERVLGAGTAGARLGNEVAPGTNKMLMAVIEDGADMDGLSSFCVFGSGRFPFSSRKSFP